MVDMLPRSGLGTNDPDRLPYALNRLYSLTQRACTVFLDAFGTPPYTKSALLWTPSYGILVVCCFFRFSAVQKSPIYHFVFSPDLVPCGVAFSLNTAAVTAHLNPLCFLNYLAITDTQGIKVLTPCCSWEVFPSRWEPGFVSSIR